MLPQDYLSKALHEVSDAEGAKLCVGTCGIVHNVLINPPWRKTKHDRFSSLSVLQYDPLLYDSWAQDAQG